MKKRIWSILASMLMFSMVVPALAAPLFPDVPDNHWAKDAVAALAAKGLVEGYPDGTFKGDRAATRWETAMIVARLLAKMEQAHATFATKAELDELRKLVNALREELDALGVRVTNLEENVARIDKRVTELERITFYGEVDARATFQSFNNNGRFDNDNLRNGGGIPTATGPAPLNYNQLVGTNAGAGLSPQNNGVWPVTDYRNGRPLTNGTGFTTRALLGLRIRVSDDIDAGAEFSAYTSQGDATVDAYWGVQQPYLSNPFTANTSVGGAQSLANTPFTRMNLDNFWVIHNPSKTKLVVGAFNEDKMDNVIYAGQFNPNANGPQFNDSYGFDVTGLVDVSDWGVLHWEVMGTRLATSTVGLFPGNGVGYEPWLFGGDLALEFEGGFIKANYARVLESQASGGGLLAGGNGAQNLLGNVPIFDASTGAATAWSPLQWVNPPGFYAAQQTAFQQANNGPGGTVDGRPISGANATNDLFVGGSFGPQVMNSFGLSGAYAFDIGEGDQIRLDGEWAHSNYRPNKNSGYDVEGDSFRVGIGANLLDGDLDLFGEYVSTDATYDPFILAYPAGTLGVQRLPNINYFTNMYSLHDTEKYPHNREGFRLKGTWKFNERRGAVWAKLGFLDQKSTSLYNVRVTAGALGGTPGSDVLGFAPGFIDPVFSGFASPAVYGAGTANSFTANLAPLENPSGSHDNYAIGATYKFDDPRIKVDLGWEQNNYKRSSRLAPGFGGSQNHVDLDISSIHGELGWEATDKWTLRGGADYVTIQGHYDPAGVYNDFAIQTGSNSFDTVNNDQFIPFIGFDYDVSENTTWNMDLRYYDTTSNLSNGTTNNLNNVGFTQNPFEFSGLQVSTQFKLKF
jgi:S-layer homology domain